MAKLTDKAKKQIIAKKAEGLSNKKLASLYHVSETTIRRVLEGDPQTAEIVARKKEENTQSILSYMESKAEIVCEIIGNALEVLADKDKMRVAPLAQITTAMGTLIDKWTQGAIIKTADREMQDDPLTASLKELAKELENGGTE